MTVLPIPSGPTIREIIDLAFNAMGSSDAMFGRTENEYSEALMSLNAMMAEWPFDALGFVVEGIESGRIGEESGIARKHLVAVAYALAERMAPTFGKTLAPEARRTKNRAFSTLCAAATAIPEARYADGTARGMGSRWRGRFFYNGADPLAAPVVSPIVSAPSVPPVTPPPPPAPSGSGLLFNNSANSGLLALVLEDF